MQKSLRTRAEEQFAATQKKAKQSLNEKEKARREIEARMAKQRGLRLAKEAADKEAAEQAGTEQVAAEKAVTEKAATEKDEPQRLPQVHRR